MPECPLERVPVPAIAQPRGASIDSDMLLLQRLMSIQDDMIAALPLGGRVDMVRLARDLMDAAGWPDAMAEWVGDSEERLRVVRAISDRMVAWVRLVGDRPNQNGNGDSNN